MQNSGCHQSQTTDLERVKEARREILEAENTEMAIDN